MPAPDNTGLLASSPLAAAPGALGGESPSQRLTAFLHGHAAPASAWPDATDPGGLVQLHARTLASALTRPLVGGNKVELLVDAASTYASMFAAIEAARDHVNVETYILEDEGPGESLAELLLRKRRSGVCVNVIFDSFGSLRTPAEYFQRLRDAGVALCEYNPVSLWRRPLQRALHLRDHRKLLVVDGRVGFVGGINFSSVYASGSSTKKRTDVRHPWRDVHLRIEGPVVEQMQEVFLAHWKCQLDRAPAPARYFPALPKAGSSRLGVAACDAGRRRNPFYRSLLHAIRHARQTVYITTAYFVPPRRLLRALERAARRGIDVRLLLPGISDSWPALAAGRAFYGRLLHAGAKLYECHDTILHAKTAVIDGVWSTVGSSNMDWRSFLHNAEVNAVGVDPDLGAQLVHQFFVDLGRARPMLLADWKHRPATQRLTEWIARRIEFFL